VQSWSRWFWGGMVLHVLEDSSFLPFSIAHTYWYSVETERPNDFIWNTCNDIACDLVSHTCPNGRVQSSQITWFVLHNCSKFNIPSL